MGIQDIGNNVRRFMKIRRFTIAKLSSKAGMGTATLSNILNGRSIPKSTTLIKLADSLDVNINDLLVESFELKTLRFRTKKLSGREKAERDHTKNETAVWLGNYWFLEANLDDHLTFKRMGDCSSNPGEAARAVRRQLNIHENEPVYNIIKVIEGAGIKLRVHDFGFKKTNGLSIGEQDGGPAIIVNSKSGISIERQIFTIAQELGHLVLHKDSYEASLKEENADEEKQANEFAGIFLVPADSFIKEWNASAGLDFIESVLRVKKIFKVSYQTILHRLCQLNDSLKLGDLRQHFAINYKRKYNHDLKHHYEPDAVSRFDLIEDRYARLVRKAYDKEIISLSRAGEMLNLSLEDMRHRSRDWQQELGELKSKGRSGSMGC